MGLLRIGGCYLTVLGMMLFTFGCSFNHSKHSSDTQSKNAMLTRLNPSQLPPSAGQSHVVISNAKQTAYLSGQIAVDSDGKLVGVGSFRGQLQQVLANIDNALAAANTSRTNVIRLTIYVVNLDVATHGPILRELLGDMSSFSHPAATLVSVAGLAMPELMIEIDVIAAVEE